MINWWSKYSLEVFKRPPSGDRTFQSVHTAKHNMMMIIWRVIYSWHDYRTGLTPSEKLNLHLNGVSCFGMEPPRTKIWGIQVCFVRKFKCANLVQIFWTKKCTFYVFHLHWVTWCVTSEDKDMRNSSRANAQLVRCRKVQRCYHMLCKLLSGFCIHPLVHCNAHTQLINKCMLSCTV